jgi:SNF2 family DNA or RNA helicase
MSQLSWRSLRDGLNLQHGGNTIIWFGLNWSLELYQQFNARLHRQGQQKPVIIHHLAVRDTVDQTVLSALRRKDMTQKALLNALKEDIERRV